MIKGIDREYSFRGFINRDETSDSYYKNIFKLKESNATEISRNTNLNNYINLFSKNIDILEKIIPSVSLVENKVLKQRLNNFLSVFVGIINSFENTSNYLPPININIEEDSLFLEWIFKDFRIGFTLCIEDTESMWFLITKKNMEELSVSGDFESNEYRPIIVKLMKYVLENS